MENVDTILLVFCSFFFHSQCVEICVMGVGWTVQSSTSYENIFIFLFLAHSSVHSFVVFCFELFKNKMLFDNWSEKRQQMKQTQLTKESGQTFTGYELSKWLCVCVYLLSHWSICWNNNIDNVDDDDDDEDDYNNNSKNSAYFSFSFSFEMTQQIGWVLENKWHLLNIPFGSKWIFKSLNWGMKSTFSVLILMPFGKSHKNWNTKWKFDVKVDVRYESERERHIHYMLYTACVPVVLCIW